MLLFQNTGDFLERLAKDTEKRAKPPDDAQPQQYPFHPTILPSSKLRKPRTIHELSLGDHDKREALLVRSLCCCTLSLPLVL
jgi:hypothetical protein